MPERHHVGWKRPRYSGSTTYPGHQEDDPSIRYPGIPGSSQAINVAFLSHPLSSSFSIFGFWESRSLLLHWPHYEIVLYCGVVL
jgi:hypothetical protein